MILLDTEDLRTFEVEFTFARSISVRLVRWTEFININTSIKFSHKLLGLESLNRHTFAFSFILTHMVSDFASAQAILPILVNSCQRSTSHWNIWHIGASLSPLNGRIVHSLNDKPCGCFSVKGAFQVDCEKTKSVTRKVASLHLARRNVGMSILLHPLSEVRGISCHVWLMDTQQNQMIM